MYPNNRNIFKVGTLLISKASDAVVLVMDEQPTSCTFYGLLMNGSMQELKQYKKSYFTFFTGEIVLSND